MPAVSVVVPNYNHARFLRRRVNTILAQTFQDFELILLDDCSMDESQSILREYASDPRVRLEFNDANSGSPFKQWNRGVRLSRGGYVWIAESDDYAEPRLLERLIAVLEAGPPNVVFAFCRSRCVDEADRADSFSDQHVFDLNPRRWAENFCADGREMCREYFALLNPIPNASAVLFRKAAYDHVGGVDEGMRLCGDWKLWAALALEGTIAYVSEPLNYHRLHKQTVRHQTGRANTDAVEYLWISRWVLERVSVSAAQLKRIRHARAAMWVPAFLSIRTSFATRCEIARYVRGFDPHPIRSAVQPAVATVRRKILRHWRHSQEETGQARS